MRSWYQAPIKLTTPLAHVSLTLLDGMARRRMLALGATEHTTMLCGMPIHFYGRAAKKDSTPLLLVHGLADSALTWSLVLNNLARSNPVYAIDLPGYGFSGLPAGQTCLPMADMQAVLAAFVREVIGRPVVLVGNSLGGWMGVNLAHAAPDTLSGLVLLNPGGAPLDGAASWQPFLDAIAVPDLRTARRVLRDMLGAVPPSMTYLGQYGVQQSMQRPVVRDFVATIEQGDFLHPDALEHLDIPAALVWGLADSFLPPGCQQFFEQHLPKGSRTLLLPWCGHLPQRERPLKVARFVRKCVADWRF